MFLVILGIMVSMMNKAGGSAAFGKWAGEHIKSESRGSTCHNRAWNTDFH